MSRALFAQILGDKLAKVTGYLDMAKKYMPKKSKSEAKEDLNFTPHPRGQGRTYRFPITVSYPLFWWQRAEISSSEDGNLGNFSGLLTDVTSDPEAIKKPIRLALSGDTKEIRAIKLEAIVDTPTETSTLDLQVGEHVFPAQQFVSSPDISLGLAEAKAAARVDAKLVGERLEATISEVIAQPKFSSDAKQTVLKEALEKVTGGISKLTMKITSLVSGVSLHYPSIQTWEAN